MDSDEKQTRFEGADAGRPRDRVTKPRSEEAAPETPPRNAMSHAVTELVTPEPVTQKAPSHLGPGTVLFGAYEIIDILGAGGMGEVYRARHLSLGDLRAIKVMHPELAHRPDALARFHAEARALLDVHHPAVVGCHDLLRDDAGRVYLVMEMVEGQSLLERIDKQPLSDSEIKQLGVRLSEGLDAAHRCGVIHRDLSPDNVLLPGGDVSKAKIIDFGIAKALATGEETISEGFKGKLAYASPEQLGFFQGRIDARSDLYSLGLLLCAAANGAPIPMGTNLKEAVDARQGLRAQNPKIPPSLRKEIAPLLALDPDDRPESAGEALSTWRGGKRPPVSARTRSRWAAGRVFGALVLAAALGAWFVFGRTPESIAPSEVAEPQPAQPEASPEAAVTRASFAALRSWLLEAPGNDSSLAASVAVDPNPVRDGASYRVSLAAECSCYLLLFSVSGDGTEVSLLYPNPYDVLERSQPGVPLLIPSSGYEFEAVADAEADELRLLALSDWPDFPPDGSNFWSANWLQADGAEQLASLREQLGEMKWMAVGTTLEIAR